MTAPRPLPRRHRRALIAGLACAATILGNQVALTNARAEGVSTGTVTGTVLSPDASTAEGGAEVDVYDATADSYVTTATANGQGGYTVTLAAGTYELFGLPPAGAPADDLANSITVTVDAGDTLSGKDIRLGSRTAAAYTVSAASVTPSGTTGNGASSGGSTSGDGRFVAFASAANDLTTASTTSTDVYLRDRESGSTTLVSATAGGAGGDGVSDSPAVSDDGTLVAFRSDAADLVSGDTNGRSDVFLRDMENQTTIRLSAGLTDDGDDPLLAGAPTMSGDGLAVAFALSQDTPSTYNVGTLELCTRAKRLDDFTCTQVDPDGDQSVSGPALSRDGTTLAYYLHDLTGWPFNPVSDDWHLEVRTAAGQTTDAGIVQVGADSGPPPDAPSLTDDGGTVAYTYYDGTGAATPTLYAVATAKSSAPTLFDHGSPAQNQATGTRISGDGRYLAFTAAKYIWSQPWVRDLDQGVTRRLVLGPDGQGPTGGTWSPAALDSDGTTVVFDGDSDEAVASTVDSNGLGDVFVARQHTDQTPPAWGDTATLRPSEIGATVTTLDWDAATDASGIASYEVFQDGAEIATVTTATHYLVTGLSPDTDYAFAVQAVDPFGNATTDGPSATVHTLTGATGGQAELSATAGPDASVDLSWDAASGPFASYRIYRAAGTGTAVALADAPTGTTTYHDASTAAETAYTYYVVTVDSGGTEHPHTTTATVTTGDLRRTQVGIRVPKLADGSAVLGGDVAVELTGSPGRTATATASVLSWFDPSAPGTVLPAPAASQVTVPLTEDSTHPGTYRGTLHIANGIAEIDGITGEVSDGDGHPSDDTATGLPVHVSGGLDVSVSDPSHNLTTARLTAFSWDTGTGIDTSVTPDSLDHQAAVTPGNYAVRLLIGTDQYASAENDSVDVASGLMAPVGLTATFPARLTVDLGTADHALLGTRIALDDTDSGQPIAGTTIDQGSSVSFGDLRSGQAITVRLALPAGARYQTPLPQEITLVPGDNGIGAEPAPLPTADVSGTVTEADDGSAVAGAAVTVRQTIDGRSFTSTGETGADGSYAVPALAGAADVLVGYDEQTQSQHFDALPSADVDFEMTHKQTYTLRLDLYTRYPGSQWVGPISVDDRTAYHYGLVASDANGEQTIYTGFGSDGSDDVTLLGRPGDRIQICATPEDQVGLPPGCVSGTLGTDPTVPLELELRLGQPDTITATLNDGSGQPFAGAWTAQAVRHSSTGLVAPIDLDGYGSMLSMGVPEDGDYDVTVTTADDTHVFATASATTVAGTVDLGTLTLRGGKWFGAGSAVSVPDNDLAAGETASVRIQLTDGDSPASGITLRIPAPEHASFAPGGVTLNGAAVGTSTVDGDGTLTVPVGDLATGATAVIYVPVVLAGDAAPATSLPISPAVSFSAGAASHTEYLTPTQVRVAGVTIQAPSTTATDSVVASGRAPAGATVTVSQLGAALTSTQASPGGYWKATVPLPDQGPYATYHLRASVQNGQSTLVSGVIAVQFQVGQPEVTEVSIYQIDPDRKDGRKFSFDPREGAVRFPFVLVPAQPLILQATFSYPDQVTGVTAHLGSGAVPATQQADGSWTAQFDASAGLGDIWFEYDTAVTEFDMTQRVPALQQRANLDPELSDLTSSVVTQTDDTVTGDVTLPSAGSTTFPVTATVSGGTATLTQADLDLIEQSGVPIMNLQTTTDADGDFLVSYDVPTIALGATQPDTPSLRPAALAPRLALPSSWLAVLEKNFLKGSEGEATIPVEEQLTEIKKGYTDLKDPNTYKNWTSTGVNAAQGANLDSPFGGGGMNNYAGISGLYDQLDQLSDYCESDEVISELRAKIDAMMTKAQMLDWADRGLSVAGVAFAGITFGGSLTFDLAGAALAIYSNASLQNDQNNLADEIGAAVNDPRCAEAKEQKELFHWYDTHFGGHHTGDLGTGVPTWDPSGTVYEAVTSQPVSGVTATLLYSDSADGPWTAWNADWYGQVNPLTTDDAGHYGWDVPKGWWKVEFAKAGYAPAFSRTVQVLPPHFDVDAGMVSLSAPTVTDVTADSSSVLVSFDQYMDPRTVGAQQVTVTGPDGPINGTITAVDPTADPDGRTLARSFRFTPDTAFVAGAGLTVRVDSLAQNYAGHLLAAPVSKSVTVPAASPPPVDGGSGSGETSVPAGGTAWSSTGHSPSASTPVVVSVTSPNAGTVTFVPAGAGPPQSGYTMLGDSFVVTAPTSSPAAPLRLAFQFDDAALPAGLDPSKITVFRDGVVVPSCAEPATTAAEPDPCRLPIGTSGGVTTVTVLTSHASDWTFGVPGKTAPAVAKVKVAAGPPAYVGRPQQVAVRVWNTDGSLAANTVAAIRVTGANAASGTVRTGQHGGLGIFSYTPAHPGLDTITATVAGHAATATVRIRRLAEHPVLGAVSKASGTVDAAVRTLPVVAGRKVKFYYVDKAHGRRAVLRYAGDAVTDPRGRAYAVLTLTPGQRYVLRARMAGKDYTQHLSERFAVTVRG